MRTIRWWLPLCLAALFAASFSCSDDEGPKTEAGVQDGPATLGDGAQPWPDLPPMLDTTAKSCTPGEAEMCSGFKTQFCDNGTCAPCPANQVDCDRQGDCECFGACDGDKCVKGGG